MFQSRVNRLSVLGAITSTQQRLKLYNNKCPENGLAIFCGTCVGSEDGKERKVNVDLVPLCPVHRKVYLCDSRFHTEELKVAL